MNRRIIRDLLLGMIRARMLMYSMSACGSIMDGSDAAMRAARCSAAVALHYQELYDWTIGWFK